MFPLVQTVAAIALVGAIVIGGYDMVVKKEKDASQNMIMKVIVIALVVFIAAEVFQIKVVGGVIQGTGLTFAIYGFLTNLIGEMTKNIKTSSLEFLPAVKLAFVFARAEFVSDLAKLTCAVQNFRQTTLAFA